MELLESIKNIIWKDNYTLPEIAYDNWADSYDDEKENLMLHYDKIFLNHLISQTQLTGKNILDYGCGTGRNLPDIMKCNPARLYCCDISINMLNKLKFKFPNANSFLIKDNKLDFLADNSVDIIISTLVAAHVKNLEGLFNEWNRVLKNKAAIIITDFHPTLLENGGERSFNYKGEKIKIKNHVHRLNEIEELLNVYGFKKTILIEKKINEEVKSFYDIAGAHKVYQKYYGFPFIFGMCLNRQYADI